ncbi:MAG: rhodanese-like domain-containing protein [Desulfobulbaceae bacterium]|nr:rhodanese-like domain-containing protein [Desulfobulbaceae bacterium]HIJ78210.1 rhodanese-like domain-containing protein [Deltaproteobacteria bacterium]
MKGYFKIFWTMILLLAMVVSCSGDKPESQAGSEPGTAVAKTSSAASVFRSVTPQEAQFMLGNRQDLLLIDVREPDELREGYIEGSRLIPMSDLAKGRASLPTGQPMLLVCAVGGRSYGIGQYYYRKGYPEIYNLSGGISAWKKAGLPLQYK